MPLPGSLLDGTPLSLPLVSQINYFDNICRVRNVYILGSEKCYPFSFKAIWYDA